MSKARIRIERERGRMDGAAGLPLNQFYAYPGRRKESYRGVYSVGMTTHGGRRPERQGNT